MTKSLCLPYLGCHQGKPLQLSQIKCYGVSNFLRLTASNGHIFRVTVLCAGNSPVTGEFPSQRPVTRSFDVFFDLRLNKRLSKHSRRRWFETPSRSLWRHGNGFEFSFRQRSPAEDPLWRLWIHHEQPIQLPTTFVSNYGSPLVSLETDLLSRYYKLLSRNYNLYIHDEYNLRIL